MKNLLKLASAAALSCTFLMAHAQQGDGKMVKKGEKMGAGKMTENKTKNKMYDAKTSGKMNDGSTNHKTKTDKDGKMMSKDKM